AAGQAGALQWRPARYAGFAASSIDEQLLLVAPADAIGVDVIDDRRASCRNAVFQNLLDRRVEGPAFTRREPMRPPARTDSSPKTCLVRVDIADPGEERLIEQGRFDRPTAGLHDPLEFGFREIATNRLPAQRSPGVG